MRISLAFFLLIIIGCVDTSLGRSNEFRSTKFTSRFHESNNRSWVGAEYYANRLQGWRINNGRVEAVEGRIEKPMRTLQLLTHTVSSSDGSLEMGVRMGAVTGVRNGDENTWSGFLLGVGGDPNGSKNLFLCQP